MGAQALFGTDQAVVDLRRDVDANREAIEAGVASQIHAGAVAHDLEVRVMADAANTQAWIAGVLINLSESVDAVADAVGVKGAHVRVPPLMRGSK